jgi:hypothetical protein
VPIEGGGSPSLISTANLVNSCSSNPATGQTVCTANNTDVYLITGNTLTNTLTSGATGLAGFSGGSCLNCGVAINALTNTAYIAEGSNTAPSQLQVLNLTTNTFQTPFPTTVELSENISVDPTRSYVLSPDEQANYALYQLSTSGAVLKEFTSRPFDPNVGGEPDSAAEDCTTGIALSSLEFTSAIFLSDLTQITFPTTSTWTAPHSTPDLSPLSFAAGTSGISVAPGGSHLGIVTGEFGGNTFAALQLPATSGTGTPTLVDYVGGTLPATPDGFGFSAGYDPHTVTAYTSPNNGKSYGVIADWARGVPSYLAIIDLKAILAAPRTAGTHQVDPTYDLVAHGVVTYVATQ